MTAKGLKRKDFDILVLIMISIVLIIFSIV